MWNIEGYHFCIAGLQRSGQALARLLMAHGARVSVTDVRPRTAWDSRELEVLVERCDSVEFGGNTEEFVSRADVLVLSPGVPWDAPLVQFARKRGMLVLGEIECAFQFEHRPLIAVTGSNGKTTVTSLVFRMLQEAGRAGEICGNIGIPYSGIVMEVSSDTFHPDAWNVLEVSSFQLEALYEPGRVSLRPRADELARKLRPFRPGIAILLNVTNNHLDRHVTMEAYRKAKWKMFQNQKETDFAILDGDDTQFRLMARDLKAQCRFFPGRDNHTNPNHAAVLEVARCLNINETVYREALRTFSGIEHRMERLEPFHGKEIINDAKSTTVEATRWAIRRTDGLLVLLCGGRDKAMDFSQLREEVPGKVHRIIAYGEAKEKIEAALKAFVFVETVASFQAGVKRALDETRPGEALLFSPMCTSFDLFQNFEERGRVFKEMIQRMRKETVSKALQDFSLQSPVSVQFQRDGK